jgi:hypothetical protein
MLHFLYSKDTTVYPDGRQRVQQGFRIIIHASSGLRPSSTESSKARRKGESDDCAEEEEHAIKLRYRDVELRVGEDERGRTRFAVQATFNYFKGGNRRPQRFVDHNITRRNCKTTNHEPVKLLRGPTKRIYSRVPSPILSRLHSTTRPFHSHGLIVPIVYFPWPLRVERRRSPSRGTTNSWINRSCEHRATRGPEPNCKGAHLRDASRASERRSVTRSH